MVQALHPVMEESDGGRGTRRRLDLKLENLEPGLAGLTPFTSFS